MTDPHDPGRNGRRPAAGMPAWRPGMAGLCLLAAVAAAAPAASAAGAAGDATLADRLISVKWTVTWGGLPIYRVRFRTEIADGRYTAEFDARSTGVVEALAKNRTFWRSTGRVDGAVMAPEKMHQRYLMKRGGYRTVTMEWAPSGDIATRIEPPENKGKRKTVPQEMRRGTVDPLTALLNGLVAPRGGPPCKYEANLFEGRRRIDIHLSFHRYGKALRVKGHDLPRKATVCLLHAKRVAGFRARHLKDVPKLRPLKMWVVRLEKAGVWLPVEMALKTRYGIARARLSKLEVR
ncbi:MAG: DUF3108 domain-containing protein [Rhodospirillaceae bacterium]|nr:DUF3108 domain-containing protein [Rhodospirillaceae bacterium]MCY4066555.1 DUF3108 domain-containing protein [Rhodospirillaceae bacterium]